MIRVHILCLRSKPYSSSFRFGQFQVNFPHQFDANEFLEKVLDHFGSLARFDVKFCHRRRISGTILMAIEVAPREALRNGTVLCREVEDFVGNVSDKAPRHLDQNA